MKIIHIADLHIGATPDSNKPWGKDRIKEMEQSLDDVIEVANREEVDLLLIAGDLFHGQPLMRQLKELNYKFSLLNKTRVIIIAGNHDYIKEQSYYNKFQWDEKVTMILNEDIEVIDFDDINTSIYAFSYHSQEITEPRIDNIVPSDKSRINILLSHGGDDRHLPFSKDRLLKSGFDYIALGHIHKHEIIGDNLIVMPGSLEPLDKNDLGDHGYIIGQITKEKRDVRFVKNAKRSYFHLVIKSDSNKTNGEILSDIKKLIDANGTNNIYKIIINGYRDADIDYDIDGIYRLGNVIEVVDDTEPDYDFEELYIANSDNMIGMYIKKLEETAREDEIARKALYYGIKAMLDTKR